MSVIESNSVIRIKLNEYRELLDEIILACINPNLEKYAEKNKQAEYYLGYYKAIQVNAASINGYINSITTTIIKSSLRTFILSYIETLRAYKAFNPINETLKNIDENDLFTKGYKDGMNSIYGEAIENLTEIAITS